jgi:hypothetical protein
MLEPATQLAHGLILAMYGIGSTEILIIAAVLAFFILWKTVGPPRWK